MNWNTVVGQLILEGWAEAHSVRNGNKRLNSSRCLPKIKLLKMQPKMLKPREKLPYTNRLGACCLSSAYIILGLIFLFSIYFFCFVTYQNIYIYFLLFCYEKRITSHGPCILFLPWMKFRPFIPKETKKGEENRHNCSCLVHIYKSRENWEFQ